MEIKSTAKAGLLLLMLATGMATPVLAQEYADELAEAQESGEYAEALRLLQPEAEKGVPEAQYSLGRMYALGQGVDQDEAEAVKWYRKAAEQGFADAQYQLGEAYGEGEGVPQDFVRAHQWMSRAAENGHPQAQAAQTSFEELMSDQQLEQARQASDNAESQ